jgi:ABC-2 type transport system ATP-binding protein
MTPSAAIELENLSMSYYAGLVRRETPALRGVSFRVEPGEVFGFLGPNGAGKTTAIHILMGFIFPIRGCASLFGYPAGDLRARRRAGFLPENFAFHRFLTAGKLLRFHLRLAGVRSDRAGEERMTQELLRRVKLETQRDVRIGRFSRGMVQRIGLAQAVLNDPDLLVLDEPTSGLDPIGRKEVRELIVEFKARGKTIFLSSHLLSEVELVCDRVAVINQGSLKQVGRVQELLGAGDQVEVVVSTLSDELRDWAQAEGGAVALDGSHTRIIIDGRHQRALIEKTWAAGADVISVNPVRSSLEDLFVKLVEGSSL